jgi:hypothetical protein
MLTRLLRAGLATDSKSVRQTRFPFTEVDRAVAAFVPKKCGRPKTAWKEFA